MTTDLAISKQHIELAERLQLEVSELSEEEVTALLVRGDLGVLSPPVQRAYIAFRCRQLGLDPATRPFDLLRQGDKIDLYANKRCSDQLRALRGISVYLVESGKEGDYLYAKVVAKVLDDRAPGGIREDYDTGWLWVGPAVKGEALANAQMKVITKAKRRVTLAICGAGMLDETEVDSIPGARRLDPEQPATDIRGIVQATVKEEDR